MIAGGVPAFGTLPATVTSDNLLACVSCTTPGHPAHVGLCLLQVDGGWCHCSNGYAPDTCVQCGQALPFDRAFEVFCKVECESDYQASFYTLVRRHAA